MVKITNNKGIFTKKQTQNQNHKQNNKKRTFRKMNCSPMVKGKTVVSDSCFPPETLVLIKSSYNKYHPNEKIVSTTLPEIWFELKNKLTTCSKEDCWLNQIEDANLRKKLNYKSFAPKKPKEWEKNPKEWLSNYDIMDVLRQYEETYPNFHVIGPTPIDFDSRPKETNGVCVWEELCNFDLKKYIDMGKTKLGIVFNLDKHDKSGSHWVSMFLDLDDKYAFYMDSAGNKIPKEIDVLLKRITQQGLAMKPIMRIHFYENCPLEHQMGTTECGMYSLYFIITMLTGETEGKFFKNYFDKIRYFKDKRIPDRHMIRYRKLFFND
jgi:hypothetical protein